MLARMNDLAPLWQLQSQMNRLFENFFEDMPDIRPYGANYPALNCWEDGENVYLEAELPGMTMENIEVLVLGNEVTLNGERRISAPENASWHRRERTQGRFSRTITLPWDINPDQVEATLHDGVLNVRLPKAESARPRKVKVLSQS